MKKELTQRIEITSALEGKMLQRSLAREGRRAVIAPCNAPDVAAELSHCRFKSDSDLCKEPMGPIERKGSIDCPLQRGMLRIVEIKNL